MRKIPEETKRNVLINMWQVGLYIVKYTIKQGYTVTEKDIKAIKDYWKEPIDVESFEKLFTDSPKPPFPFYDTLTALEGMKKQETNKTA